MSNTFTTDLITRDLDGEDVAERAEAHNDFFLSAYRTHLTLYEGQYVFWDNPMVMNVKIGGNNIFYWGCLGLLFFHRKLTDLELMAAVRPDVERIWTISRRLEALYREWNELESRVRGRQLHRGQPAWFLGDVRAAHGDGGRLRRRDAEGEARLQRRPDGGLHGARVPQGRTGSS